MANDKYEYYALIKPILTDAGYDVGEYKDINYGIQFIAAHEGISSIIRIYQSKKGITVDLSQVKLPEEAERLNRIFGKARPEKTPNPKSNDDNTHNPENSDDEIGEGLIGVDESGKGDYFGPLVIAGVYVDAATAPLLRALKVKDSKKLSDIKIRSIAADIRMSCPYDVIAISNRKYNELYGTIKNLNKLLAWGHARVIENLLSRVECRHALSDQFGNPDLIKNALMERGRSITLEQRPRAEENIAVAAASILARDEFVNLMEQMRSKHNIDFPMGASGLTVQAGKEFIKLYGREQLADVAKLHFKTTDEILDS